MTAGMSENIVVAKVTSMVVLGGAALMCALLPVFIDRRMKKKNMADASSSRKDFILTLCLAFGGGVLLCTTFLHLLPEVSENIETLQSGGQLPKNFPLALPELIMCCGFFIMYIVEEVVHKFVRSHYAKRSVQGYDNPLAVSMEGEMTLTETYDEVLRKKHTHEEDVKIISGRRRSYGSSCGNPEVNHNHDSHVHHDHQPNHHSHSHDHSHSHGHSHSHSHGIVTNTMPSLREFLLVLALTIHEGFEGCAIGLESSAGAVWYLMAAVAVHKCVIAFCIGVEFVSGQISIKLSVFYAFVYSCASPVGIAVGLALTTSGSSSTNVASVVLQGIATGTLLYVVFFEVLKRDNNCSGGLTQMIAVLVGFACMAAITTLIDA